MSSEPKNIDASGNEPLTDQDNSQIKDIRHELEGFMRIDISAYDRVVEPENYHEDSEEAYLVVFEEDFSEDTVSSILEDGDDVLMPRREYERIASGLIPLNRQADRVVDADRGSYEGKIGYFNRISF